MSAPRRAPRLPIDGVLLLDKPVGLTSNHALQAARRLLNAEKAGHTGTLDPLASGLLPLCFGQATKFSQSLLDADKAYLATLCLGVRTDTFDAEGQVTARAPVGITRADLEAVITRFTGEIEQIPPMHSALKRDGRPLYEYARAGITLEREVRRVRIHTLSLISFDLTDPTRAVLEVACSKGTYIRTLADDIGQALGCGAHLTALRRTRVGTLDVSTAATLDALEHAANRATLLSPADALLAPWPALTLDREQGQRLLFGQRVLVSTPDGDYRAYSGDHFLGAVNVVRGVCHPLRLMNAAASPAPNESQ